MRNFWFTPFCRMILLIQGSNGPWLINSSFQKYFPLQLVEEVPE